MWVLRFVKKNVWLLYEQWLKSLICKILLKYFNLGYHLILNADNSFQSIGIDFSLHIHTTHTIIKGQIDLLSA